MWGKNGEKYKGFIVEEGMVICNPSAEQLRSNGWVQQEDEVSTPEEPVIFSKYKIAQALGAQGYAALLARIEAAGLSYLYEASNELNMADENFKAFYDTLSAEEKNALNACRA